MKLKEFVKQKADSHKFAYDESSWTEFEKQLSNAGLPAKSNKGLKFVGSIVAILLVGLVGYFMFNNIESEKVNIAKEKTYISKNEIVTINTEVEELENTDKLIPHTNSIKENTLNENSDYSITENVTEEETQIENILESEKSQPCKNIQNAKKETTESIIPNAYFTTNVTEGCQPLKVEFLPCEKSDSVIFLWNFGDGTNSTERTPSHIYEKSGEYAVVLTVKHYTSSKLSTILGDNKIYVKASPQIEFEYTEDENNIFKFVNQTEDFSRLEWSFGFDKILTEESTEMQFNKAGEYPVKLTAYLENGCVSTKSKNITVDVKHKYFMPNAFVPDGDGRNETFGPVGENLGDYKYKMYIYNKFGELVFETENAHEQWDGKFKGVNEYADFGVYAWIIITKDKFGNEIKKKGSVTLLKK